MRWPKRLLVLLIVCASAALLSIGVVAFPKITAVAMALLCLLLMFSRSERDRREQLRSASLLAVRNCGDAAHSVAIEREVDRILNRSVPIIAVYQALDSLVDDGVLKTWKTPDTEGKRGGRPRNWFAITEAGEYILAASKESQQ
jgi:DNA-binding PadR family transcriptional regulator